MDIRQILAKNLRSLMKHAGIKSQAQLASITGVSQTQIGNLLSQKKGASIDTLERLANGLGCSTWLLLTPVEVLEVHHFDDFAPLVHCYMNIPYDGQKKVWNMAHQMYVSTNITKRGQEELSS